jgi:Mn-dependent DtxR family transcriptional regulator
VDNGDSKKVGVLLTGNGMNKSAEDYLKTIYILKGKVKCLHAVDIARELGFSKPSVSSAMANLKKDGLIAIKDDGEIEFTKKGLKVAKDIYDRYVMLCGFLQNVAGVDETIAKEDACRMEHCISKQTREGIQRFVEENEGSGQGDSHDYS